MMLSMARAAIGVRDRLSASRAASAAPSSHAATTGRPRASVLDIAARERGEHAGAVPHSEAECQPLGTQIGCLVQLPRTHGSVSQTAEHSSDHLLLTHRVEQGERALIRVARPVVGAALEGDIAAPGMDVPKLGLTVDRTIQLLGFGKQLERHILLAQPRMETTHFDQRIGDALRVVVLSMRSQRVRIAQFGVPVLTGLHGETGEIGQYTRSEGWVADLVRDGQRVLITGARRPPGWRTGASRPTCTGRSGTGGDRRYRVTVRPFGPATGARPGNRPDATAPGRDRTAPPW